MSRLNTKSHTYYFLISLLVTYLACHAGPTWSALNNQLSHHISPYLAMHGDDPVHWQDWSENTLNLAKQLNKPLFISSGYFACHWCHVMQRESYQNPAIAALLNEHFIPVKIDRELQPALDEHLIDFVSRTRGSAGWPLNVFLTPEGHAFYGLTYAPAAQFKTLLTKLQSIWRDKKNQLLSIAQGASQEIAAEKTLPYYNGTINKDDLHQSLMREMLRLSDELEGGFGNQSRFPMSPQWRVLVEQLAFTSYPEIQKRIKLTLDQMMNQGLRDQLAGGFFRYTIDPAWQVPHFEKMLYNQALQIQLFLTAAKQLNNNDYLDVAKDTLDFTLQSMQGTQGGFIASLSAVDQQGVEGAGYLWSTEQLTAVLNPEELILAQQYWGMSGTPNTEHGYLPIIKQPLTQIAKEQNKPRQDIQQQITHIRQKLLTDRSQRNHPKDTKQLAAWNGLMLSALVQMNEMQPSITYRKTAQNLRNYLTHELWNGKQLFRAKSTEGAVGTAALEDYVYVAKALWDWSRLTHSKKDLAIAKHLMQLAWDKFYDNGWLMSETLILPNMAKKAQMEDGPLPSPVAMLLDLSLELGDDNLVKKAKKAARLAYQQIIRYPIYNATQVAVSMKLADPMTKTDAACQLKPEIGQCRAAMPRFYFDQTTQKCQQFTWAGCDGVVPFKTLDNCTQACEK